ncbi:hypothetical protein BH11CYA1_BH11CYA1_13300 [soil metagenome]
MTSSKESEAAKMRRLLYGEMERKLQDMFGPEHKTAAQIAFGGAWQSLNKMANQGKTGLQSALDMVNDLAQDISEIESFNITPKPPAEIEVDMRMKKEKELPFKQNVAPFVELESVCIANRVHFQALFDKEKNGLRCSFNEGFSLRFKTFLGKLTVPINGNAVLMRDQKNQIVMEVSTKVPGIDLPVSLTIPLVELLREARKRSA